MGIDLTTGEIIEDLEIENNIEDNVDIKKGKGYGFSCRTNKEIYEKLKQWQTELGATKTDVFKLMVDSFEMEKLKGSAPGRAKEIDTFAATINSLITMYNGSLEINANAEATLRENFNKDLADKNEIILKLETDKKELLDNIADYKKLEKNIKELSSTKETLEKEIINLKQTNNTLTKYNTKVDAEVETLKKYKDENIKLETDIKELNKIIDINNKDINNKNLENKNLENEITLLNKTIVQNTEVYKQLSNTIENERDRLIQDINNLNIQHKDNIKELKQEHIQAINILKTEHIEAINTLKSENEKNLDRVRDTIKQDRTTHDINLKKLLDENTKLKEEINKLTVKSK